MFGSANPAPRSTGFHKRGNTTCRTLAVPTLIAVAIMLPVVVVIVGCVSVVAHLSIVVPTVPLMAGIPVTVLVTVGDIAQADADADVADMDADSDALGGCRARYRQSRADKSNSDDCAIQGFIHVPFLPNCWRPRGCGL